MAGRGDQLAAITEPHAHEQMAGRDRHPARLEHGLGDTRAGRIRSPHQHTDLHVTHGDIAARRRNQGSAGQTDRARRNARFLLAHDDAAVHIDVAGDDCDCAFVGVFVDADAKRVGIAGRLEHDGIELLALAVDGQLVVTGERGAALPAEVLENGGELRAVGLNLGKALEGELRFVVAANGIVVGIAVEELAQPVGQSVAELPDKQRRIGTGVGDRPARGADRCA